MTPHAEEARDNARHCGATFEALHVNSQDELALATPAIAGDRLLLLLLAGTTRIGW